MSKLISKITARSNSTTNDQKNQPSVLSSSKASADDYHESMNKLHSISMSRRSSSISKKTTAASLSISTSSISDNDVTNLKPKVKSPDWSIRYDPTLSVYYYVNDKTNEIQFDHPDEVVSPTASPKIKTDPFNNNPSSYDTDHRKIFSTSLKRTLSPKFFSSINTSSSEKYLKPRSKPQSPRDSIDVQSKSTTLIPNKSEADDSEMDEDVEEFRKQLELEMKTYEIERLRST